MKKVVYRDPEYGLQTVRIDDDESGEALEEVLAALDEMYRHYHNLTAMEQYHTAEHVEGLEYEKAYDTDEVAYYRETELSSSLPYHSTPEEYLLIKEEQELRARREEEKNRKVAEALGTLTPTQYRRSVMKGAGMTLRKIADLEGTDYSSVAESLEGAKKKFKKFFPEYPHK